MTIVERLRQFQVGNPPCLAKEAADRIEALESEVQQLKTALDAEISSDNLRRVALTQPRQEVASK